MGRAQSRHVVTHHRARAARGDKGAPRPQVVLAQRALVGGRGGAVEPAQRRPVPHKVLCHRKHLAGAERPQATAAAAAAAAATAAAAAAALQAVDGGASKGGDVHRILAEALLHATKPTVDKEVEHGREDGVAADRTCSGSHRCHHAAQQLGLP